MLCLQVLTDTPVNHGIAPNNLYYPKKLLPNQWPVSQKLVESTIDYPTDPFTLPGIDISPRNYLCNFFQVTRQCSLDKATQNLVQLVFDNDMFRDQMTKLNINTQRMPLGKLSKQQIAKGFKALG